MSDRVDYNESEGDTSNPQLEVSKYGRVLMHQMAPLKLEAANHAGDRSALEDAVRNFDELGMGDTPQAETARALLENVIRHEADLANACDLRNRQRILTVLDDIRRDELWFNKRPADSIGRPRISMYLRKNIEEAQHLADSLAIDDVPPPVILAMDKKTMTELKSYVKPTPMIHRVMQAALLLFNEDEEKTASWSYCKKLLVPEGPVGLNRKLMRLNPDEIHPFIVQRVQDLLKGINLRDVQKASPGAATFFVWALTVVSAKNSSESNDTPSVSGSDDGKLTKEQRAKQESAELLRSIKKEKQIFSSQKKTSDASADGLKSPRKLPHYTVIY